ncbi:MAG: trigger factor, partial [Bacteroidetes bacterium]
MNISRTYNEELQTAEIVMEIAPEDYQPQVNTRLKAQARKASLPGFR